VEGGTGNLEEYRDTGQACKDEFRKAKAHLELNVARDVKKKQEGLL